jgi:hypothetical protein
MIFPCLNNKLLKNYYIWDQHFNQRPMFRKNTLDLDRIRVGLVGVWLCKWEAPRVLIPQHLTHFTANIFAGGVFQFTEVASWSCNNFRNILFDKALKSLMSFLKNIYYTYLFQQFLGLPYSKNVFKPFWGIRKQCSMKWLL